MPQHAPAFDPYAASYEALTDYTTEADCLCAGCGRFTCNNPECNRGPLREVEFDTRHDGQFDLADLAREAADSWGQHALAERMALRRVIRWIDGEVQEVEMQMWEAGS